MSSPAAYVGDFFDEAVYNFKDVEYLGNFILQRYKEEDKIL